MVLLAGLFLTNSSVPPEPEGFARMKSVLLFNHPMSHETNVVNISVVGETPYHRRIKKTIQLEPSPGAPNSTKAYVLDGGQVAIFVRHVISRFNNLVLIEVKNRKITTDEEASSSIVKMLPKKLQMDLMPDNIRLDGLRGNLVKLDFCNRDEKDGVKATFRVHNRMWICVRAKYWRNQDWDGVRRF